MHENRKNGKKLINEVTVESMCPALSFHGLKKKIRISPTLSFMLCLIKHHLYVNFIAQFKVFV